MKIFVSRLLKLRTVVYILLGVLLLAGIVYAAGVARYGVPQLISSSKFQLLILAILELLLIFTLSDIYYRNVHQSKPGLLWKLALVFSAGNLVILIFLFRYYGLTARAEIPSVAIILRLVPYLAVILAGLLLVSFWNVFAGIIRKAWDFVSFDDDRLGARRGKLVTAVILVVCLAAGLVLRLINLDNFPMYVDEYPHIRTALSLLRGEAPAYTRAYYLVTLPVYLSFKLFGTSEWAARLPMVILNMLAIFPLYFLGKKINRFTGYASVVLFTVNPWIVSVARTVREYAIVPFFFFLSAVYLLDLLDYEGLTPARYFRRNLWKILVLAAIAGYVLIDPLSNYKIILVNYGVFAVFLMYKAWRRIGSRRARMVWAGIAALLVWIFLEVSGIIPNYIDIFFRDAGIQYWASLVNNPYRQWSYLLPGMGYLVILFALFYGLKFFLGSPTKSDTALSYCFIIFSAILFYLVFILNEGIFLGMVRYGALLEYWYVLAAAEFVFIVYFLIRKFVTKPELTGFLFGLFCLAFFVNYPAFAKIYSFTGGVHPVTREGHIDIEPAYQMLLPLIDEEDAILSSQFASYDGLHENAFRNNTVIQYSNAAGKQLVHPQDTIAAYPEGWIVLTSFSDLPEEDFAVADRTVDYLGKHGDEFIWHWYESQTSR